MLLSLIFGIIFVGASILFTINIFKEEMDEEGIGFVLIFNTIGMFCLIYFLLNINQPTALDVYRGNTTLEITSVNGVPTDTVVIFKKK